MTLTIELKNQGTLNLLRELESLGLIHMQSPPGNIQRESGHSKRWLRGCCKDLPEGSVDEFLARCRIDKQLELAIEKRQEQENNHRAKLPS